MNKTVLIVDDVQMFIDIQKEFLRESRVQIMTAKNGLDALKSVKLKTPDLIFMDLHMPQMDGVACCRAIKSDPSLTRVPVIMVTAMGKSDDTEYAFSAGCDDFLTKPLDRNLFLEAARRFINGIDRREKRQVVGLQGVFSTNSESLSTTIYDLSAGGAYIVSDHPVAMKQVLKLFFTLPDGTRIECHGRVAWINCGDVTMPKGFGVQFALLTKSAREILARFVETKH